MDKRKSDIVFDEVGYNVGQEVKNLIYSLDRDDSYGSHDEALVARIAQLEDELAEEKAKAFDLRKEVERLEVEIDCLKSERDVPTEEFEDDGR